MQPPPQPPHPDPPGAPPVIRKPAQWRRKVARAIPWLLAAFAAGLIVQVFLAGLGVMGSNGYGMGYHRTFAHVLEMLPPLLVAVGFVGADKRVGIVAILLLLMFQAQYLFLAAGSEDALVRALHPANGAAILAVTVGLLMHRAPWKRQPTPQAASA